ncbi:dihydrodipicolinate synthase family protein [Sciscionella sediminilitoris]|uniref:dihydrodipicolinate synthase family protein n=1 Tax=Sciscionella sediminilitoris TaxID=1445613 RepID=UPI0004DEE54A|nr:dihydrodipicolinate synthase family protein [Sciscionella sp. SE31]
MPDTPTGLIPILATPFTERGELDLPSLRSLVEFELASGADGLAVFGMASEGFALTAAERATILREVRELAGPRVPIVAGINGTSTVNALEQIDAASGADQVMVLPPFLVKPGLGQVTEFFAEVAERGGIPVMIQDAPGVTGTAIEPAAIAKLAEVPGITAIKVEAPPTPPKIAAVRETGLTVLGGQNAQALIEEYDNGAVGTMPACEFTDLLRPILDDLAAGRRTEARSAFTALLPLIHLGVRPGQAWAVHKEVLRRRGIIASSATRLPARPLEPVTAKALGELLDELALPAWHGGPR